MKWAASLVNLSLVILTGWSYFAVVLILRRKWLFMCPWNLHLNICLVWPVTCFRWSSLLVGCCERWAAQKRNDQFMRATNDSVERCNVHKAIARQEQQHCGYQDQDKLLGSEDLVKARILSKPRYWEDRDYQDQDQDQDRPCQDRGKVRLLLFACIVCMWPLRSCRKKMFIATSFWIDASNWLCIKRG